MSAALRAGLPLWELERAALDDDARLAELWELALRASFRLGYDTGHQRGVIVGRAEEATAWQAIVTGYSAVLTQPRREELVRLRMPSNEPCSARCSRCSRCVRAAVVARNLARYGCPDYPGRAGLVAQRRQGATPR
jgi:hypothetical protein